MKKILTLDRIATAVFWTLLGILMNNISNWFIRGWTLGALLFILFLSGIISLVSNSQKVTRAKMGQAISLQTEEDCSANARQGLIVFVSLYNPLKDKKFRQLTEDQQKIELEKRRIIAKQGEYDGLNLEKSNLELPIKAITSHQKSLQHCWLIATQNGSSVYVPSLVNYLQNEKGFTSQNCQFHYGPEYEIFLDRRNETEVVEKTRRMIDRIFAEAQNEYKLKTKQILADITGGPRSMPLGMTLACLDGSRDIQFVGTQYDDTASPYGDLTPILFKFETILAD